jgi:crossover junction endodeoxyribonuclease RuvC
MVQAPVDNSSKPTKREHLAFMIADAFNDLGQIKLYVIYCKKPTLKHASRSRASPFSFTYLKPMHTKRMKILAIDPGTREMGVAVLEGEQLVYYGVKTIRGRRSPAEVLRRIQEITETLIRRYRPHCLAIEKMFLIQKSASLLVVAAEEVKATARQHGLSVHEYAPTLVRKMVCRSGRATKAEAARVVTSRFPELRPYLEQRTKWETLYYANMFDAVALALCCAGDSNRDNPSVANHNRNDQSKPKH